MDHPCPAFKAVLIGDSGVGKTALVTRWSTGVYHKNQTSTIGASHQRRRLVVAGDDVEIFIWDTAGQEQFQSLTPLYARSAAVAILVASIDKGASFEHIDQWISLLGQSGPTPPPVVLAVNKIDLLTDYAVKQEEPETQYGLRFNGLFFVSALTNENVSNLFIGAAEAGYAFVKAGSEVKVPEALPKQAEGRERCC
jgi:small GTP-binding protein